MRDIMGSALMTILLAFAGFAVADFLFVQRQWTVKLRMTKQEVGDETKQSQGDKALLGRRRTLARRRTKRSLAASVPRATFVLANPTHVSVALRYVISEGGAPQVVAKGRDLVALRIRQMAKEHDIPVIQNVALARALFGNVGVDEAIPPEFYRAVADVIILLQKHISQGAAGPKAG